MSIEAIRFRAAEAGVILQVLERESSGGYGYREERGSWRDAKVEDLLEVARYTRAYDSLDNLISGLQGAVDNLQAQVHRVLDTPERKFDQFPG